MEGEVYNDTQQYTLSFVPPRRRPKTKPELVVTTETSYLEELQKRCDVLTERAREHADSYCGAGMEFSFPVPSLFGGPVPFGYGRCGLMRPDGEKLHFHFELRDEDMRQCITLSLKVLLMTLNVEMPARRNSNQPQQVEIDMRCDWDMRGYGHAMGGNISSELFQWIKQQAHGHEKGARVPVPQKVVSAMRTAWRAVAQDGTKRYASDCGGYLTSDGRFMLECFGNACDIAIYPDGSCGDLERGKYVRFSCHNLDSSAQQLTLLAGLAQLCELARQDDT